MALKNVNTNAPQKDERPLLSVITVCLNAAASLPRTLASLKCQTFEGYEFIAIDGGSTDGTQSQITRSALPCTTLVSEHDDGLYYAMNKGLVRARGRYVMFLNAGDALHSPDTLRLIADAINCGGKPGVVYGQTDIVDAQRVKVSERHLIAPETLDADSFKQGMVVCHQAFVARRDIAGMFDVKYRFSADYDWCVRCLQKSAKNVYIDAVLIDYLNEGLTTANRRRSLRERFCIMCKYYGVMPTIFRHLTFIPRYIRYKRREKREERRDNSTQRREKR